MCRCPQHVGHIYECWSTNGIFTHRSASAVRAACQSPHADPERIAGGSGPAPAAGAAVARKPDAGAAAP